MILWIMNLVHRFQKWREWKAKDRQEIFVGSCVYTTRWVNEKGESTDQTDIICSFLIDGNGERYTLVDSPDTSKGKQALEEHRTMREDRHNWENFDELKDYVRRPSGIAKGKLVSIKGGIQDD